jgi:hypothetical protein
MEGRIVTRAEKWTAVLAVIGGLAALAWAGGQFSASADVGAGSDDGDTNTPDIAALRAARGQLCGDVPGLPERHPLHRRHDGHAMRSALCAGGWSWFLDPPMEAFL